MGIIKRKTFLGLLLGLAVLTMACICCPINLLPFFQSPSVPSATPSQTSPAPQDPGAVSQACAANLSQMLADSEKITRTGLRLNEEYTLVTYTVSGDILSNPFFAQDLPNELERYKQDAAAQEEIWDFFTSIIPAEYRNELTRFVLFTDGINETLGAVEQTDDPQYWMLEMDMEDASQPADLATTLIHEFAHLLTLNATQVQTDFPVFNHPQNRELFEREALTCPTYFVYEGCSHPDSYLNAFFTRFWTDIFPEWKGITDESDEDVMERKLDSFYQEYAVQFVSEYAASSPEEDIAESFMYFIFTPKPPGTDIGQQKTLFFYAYPELVSLREHILGSLCDLINE